MQAFLAMMSHETNTFSNVPTDRAQFEARDLRYGGEIVEHFRGTGTCVGGMIEAQITSQGFAHCRGQVNRDCECRLASCGFGSEPQRIIIRGMILEMIIEKLARGPVAPGA